ncbi:hypothetical protein GO003_010455 [Methylicorpusculum oleiharenae]|uniref:hypothetical protein n=1 Tax=Methylicorpusculum oleiharenae TaxID=1338687 RepID=UPI001357FDF8|nr:hypothetical protein [Methylicorpusculum oleiharenae]MCD2450811.1 hypothetical protein [Methylicorpusculum oleiharenae]
MLQSYQAIYDHGRLTWLRDKPSVEEAYVIVTLLPPEKDAVQKTKRQPSTRIAGQGKILGDIIAPAAPIEDWNGLA